MNEGPFFIEARPVDAVVVVSNSSTNNRNRAPGVAAIALLGGFRISDAQHTVDTPRGAARLIAFIALHAPTARALVAGVLWPDVDEHRAQASLRTGLWQVHQRCASLLIACGSELTVGNAVRVDTRELDERAHRILEQPHTVTLAELTDPLSTRELLPGWYDDWVLQERERSRQLRLHTLEAAGEELLTRHKPGPALDAALTAIATEPLRESAHRLAIRIHLAEGNPTEALRHYFTFRRRLRDDVGVAPTAQLHQLIATVRMLPSMSGSAGTPGADRYDHSSAASWRW